jgi:hypothetical protein
MSDSSVMGPGEGEDVAVTVDIIREGFDRVIFDMVSCGCLGILEYIAAHIEAGPCCDTRSKPGFFPICRA